MTITTENICVTKFSRVGFQIIHSGDKVHTKLIIIHIVISIKKIANAYKKLKRLIFLKLELEVACMI
ncbi:hypothetical protein CQW88_13860 [Citrobacter freundii]|nr:hypothetical protein CQW88_13860 [Citrobacter freundii]